LLVAEAGNHRVSHFSLSGAFIKIFAGSLDGRLRDGDRDGALTAPIGITVLGPSGEIAVTDQGNHRVQIFDSEGNYKRKFGTLCARQPDLDSDGQFNSPSGITSDAHGNLLVADYTNRLQVFSSEGKHLCTRNDLGFVGGDDAAIAWGASGGVAIAVAPTNKVLVWPGRA
jgi:hypothetical protein